MGLVGRVKTGEGSLGKGDSAAHAVQATRARTDTHEARGPNTALRYLLNSPGVSPGVDGS